MSSSFASLSYHNRVNSLAAEEDALLVEIERKLVEGFGLRPVMATEIEFYLAGSDALGYPDSLLYDINQALVDAGIHAHPVEKERCPEQYEIALHPMGDAMKLAQQTREVKRIVAEVSANSGVNAIFAAKPFADLAGNGLHLHVHLEDSEGRNHFFRDEEERYSAALLHAVHGMLSTMPDMMLFFAPSPESYARFKPGENAPTHICWGPNNRTVALRLPPKPLDHKHIEHRVSGADAEPALAIAGMLMGIHYGLQQRKLPDDPVHGEAWKPMYDAKRLPVDFDEALEHMRLSFIVSDYIPLPLLEDFIRRALLPEAY